mmetsp:Transcript_11989/g.39854  ORF Transcript_11989/g.39854 Transcript_11989/m.39854 type:complete len:142 (+) Transcript_11989:262-687(+)
MEKDTQDEWQRRRHASFGLISQEAARVVHNKRAIAPNWHRSRAGGVDHSFYGGTLLLTSEDEDESFDFETSRGREKEKKRKAFFVCAQKVPRTVLAVARRERRGRGFVCEAAVFGAVDPDGDGAGDACYAVAKIRHGLGLE